MTEAVSSRLDRRLQSLHARQRLVIEADHEARAPGDGLNLSRDENWYSAPYLIRNTLRLMGLYRRGTQNAENPIVRHNTISSARLPTAFDGFTVLHISDMHVDNSPGAMKRLAALVPDLNYDLCVAQRMRAVGTGGCTRLSGGYRRCQLLSPRQHREGGGGHTSGRILNPAVAHSGNLPPGRTRGLRSATRRPHPWWADLFAGLDPNYAQSAGPSASLGIGVVESREYGRLHLGRCRLRPCAGTPQLPA
jgi:hypothetical protein